MTNKAGRPRQQTAIPLGFNRWILMGIACILCVFNGPVALNWPSFRDAMMRSGVYEWRCEGDFDANGSCSAQRIAITQCGNLASTMMFVGSIFAGIFADHFGPKLCSTLGSLMFAVSYLFLAVSSQSAQLYLPAWIINGTAIEFCFMGLLTIPNLFPNWPRVSLAALGTFRSLAMGYSIVFNWMVTDTFSINRVSWISFAIAIFWAVVSYLILPSEKFLLILPTEAAAAEEEAHAIEDGKAAEKSVALEEARDQSIVSALSPEEEKKNVKKEEYRIFGERILTFTYFAWLVCFALSYTRGSFYALSVPDQSPDVVNVFSWIAPLSFIPCPFLGYAADTLGTLPVLFFLNTCGTLMFICLVIGDSLALQWIPVILSGILLSFLASQNYCWIVEAYEEIVQGKLAGLAMCVAGLFSLVNTPLYSWAERQGTFRNANIIFLCFSIFNFLLLVFMYLNKASTLAKRGDRVAATPVKSQSIASSRRS